MRKTAPLSTAAAPVPEAAPVTVPAPPGEVTEKAHFEYLPIGSIKVVRNTRKTFEPTALQELAQSIGQHGVLQPVVVRPAAKGKHYELVAGERRLRGSQMAGLSEVPATIRHLTDREFLEVQLLENLQRQDVHPAEEAVSFTELIRNGFTHEEIALKIGRTASFVAQRAQLTQLTKHWMKEFEQGGITIGAAIRLARLSHEIQGLVAARQYGRSDTDERSSVLTATQLDYWLSHNVYLDLHQAAFPKKDAELLSEAGACTTCAKRTGCQSLLFPELNKKDHCLDKVCFEAKKAAFVKLRIAELREQDPGTLLVTGEYQWQNRKVEGDLVVTGRDHFHPSAEGYKGPTVKAVVFDGADAGKVINVVLKNTSNTTAAIDTKAERQKQIRDNKIKRIHKNLMAGAVLAAFTNPDTRELVASRLLDHQLNHKINFGMAEIRKAHVEMLCSQYGFPEQDETSEREWFKKNVVNLPIARKLDLLVQLTVFDGLDQEYNPGTTYADLLPELVNIKKLKEQATAQVDAASKKPAAPAPKPKKGQHGVLQPEPAPGEPLTFLSWCRSVKELTPAQARMVKGILEDKTFPQLNEGLLIMNLHIEHKGGTPEHLAVLRELYELYEAALAGREEVPA